MNNKDEVRFWDKVDIRGADECWGWMSRSVSDGYGLFKVDGKLVGAHRVSYELMHGAIPEGLCICHTCDNRLCCNSAHLFLGTVADNNSDRKAKGRNANRHGESNTNAKLTEAQVREIRERYAAGGILQRELAQEYGVSRKAISLVVTNKRWQ